MMRVLLAVALCTAPVAAQAPHAAPPPDPWLPRTAHYAKWVTAAGAVTLTAFAVREHRRSAEQWDQLLALCGRNNASCTVGHDGRYVDPAAERYYQGAIRRDRRARVRLLGGQGALLLSAALFLIDLRHGGSDPDNIPFAPLDITANHGTARVGIRLAF